MTLQDLLDSAVLLTGEDTTFIDGVKFINDAISKINIECNAIFPTYTSTDSTAVIPFPEKWQRALIIPFVSGRIKQVDSSQFEYSQHFSEFSINLVDFKDKYNIPTEYQDADANTDSYEPDFSYNYNIGDWSSGSNSTDPTNPLA